MKSILVLSGNEEVFRKIRSSFHSEYRLGSASSSQAALDILHKKRYDSIFFDIGLLQEAVEGNQYRAALEPFWRMHPTIKIIIMTPQEMIREAVRAVKAGASDYVTFPIVEEEVRLITETVMESTIVQSELEYLRDQFWEPETLEIVQTKNAQMEKVYDKIRSVAPTKSTVLLMGETGTGKGVLANLIHQHSNRRNDQFISVHCGAIPDTLLESELFGHEKGAFTGAIKRKLGKFEIASGGTIFLDEVGTITPSAQIKLLQVLQDGTFQRVGGEETFDANVRVVTATNADLKEMCEEGRFRKDLYYRLNVFPIEIPPLRERPEDIPHLVEGSLKRLNMFNTKEIYHIDTQVLEAFRHYSWPGNIRELENLIERAYILESSPRLTPESFPSELFESGLSFATLSVDSSSTLAEVRRRGIENIERNYLKDLLTQKKGKIKESAEAAGITTRQLHKLMAKHEIRKEEFK
ncbi:MAG: sigma-54 dependent transcriptional regulator [Desulfobacteraceae bacterium]|jgi:DNA-binding NtrC family response regulator